jgi:hypothetical protein
LAKYHQPIITIIMITTHMIIFEFFDILYSMYYLDDFISTSL